MPTTSKHRSEAKGLALYLYPPSQLLSHLPIPALPLLTDQKSGKKTRPLRAKGKLNDKCKIEGSF